ncbi:PAS domain S-box protein [Thiorhodococcus mannitoliphagus]|uniref:histidine kinase n=1 Tax=Thiorhodococcus mannitoliphagus TaxID=329406 RepID=A0A6P1DS06_9GAMM|nr:PAS domain S-box protein [Thiorhodococcus mannitoliphagus]NEX21057.1 PAS domain S-box protein [Thiorhodococcus mannitoliphagus]
MSEPLRILLLEDSAVDAELTERALRKAGLNFVSRRVQARDPFLAELDAFAPDIVLADYQLPQFDGRQALDLAHGRQPLLPFIFVTGALGEEAAVELLRAGANDYILKDRLTRLPTAITRALTACCQQEELQATQAALRESETRYRALVESTLDWIWEVDAEMRYTYVSPVCQQLLGYSPAELLGRTPFDFMAPDVPGRAEQALVVVAAEHQPFAMLENICLHKDGRRVVLETSGTPLFARDGSFQGYRGIDRDITARKRDEAALRLQTRRATALLELPRAAERMTEVELMQFGLELAEELTESAIAFIHLVHQDQEEIELVTWSGQTLEKYCQAVFDRHYPVSQAGIWADAVRQRAPVVFNDYAAAPCRKGLPEGHSRLDRLISLPVIEGDLVRMMVGVGNKVMPYSDRDVETLQLIANEIWRIVRQRRAEQELRESEVRYHTLVKNMRNGVCIFAAQDDGQDFLIQDGNLAMERIEGTRLAEIRGRRLSQVFPGAEALGLMDVLRRVWQTGVPERLPPAYYEDPLRSGWREGFVYRLPDGGLVSVYDDISERIELEMALEESRERLALALDAAEVGMWDWRVPTGEVQVNARWARMLGYEPSELEPITIGTWEGLCQPDDFAVAQRALERHFAGKLAVYEAETRLTHKDGHFVWVLDRGRVVERDADGRPLRMAGTHIDISARKRSEARLMQLSLAVEQTPASIVITDIEGRIQYVNPAFAQASGYSAEEAVGENPRILSSGKTPPEVHRGLWDTLARGEVWRGEFLNKRKDGGEYVEQAVISPVRQSDGQVTHYVAVKEDITEKKRVEQELEHYRHNLEELVETRTAELRLAEERSRLILESSADGLFGEDIEGRATFINPAACAMLGFKPEDVLGRCVHELIHHSHADGTSLEKSQCPLHAASTGHRVIRQVEDVFWRANGRSFPVTYSSHPMYKEGEIIGSVISFIDISVQKQTEAAREAALAEAERLARLKSEFLANMSHEIRTPLNAVLGFAQVGERHSEAGGKARDYFKRILDSGQLLLGIVNDILDFSKIDAGKLIIAEGMVDLRALIERATDMIATRLEDKGLKFSLEEGDELPASFRGDDLRLAQVLGNLLSNAIKFTERGEVTLSVLREGDDLRFCVEDTGIGMTPEQVNNLYHPFEQADGSITRRFGGTGLGLAISKRLVEMMGGGIRVRSQPGQGTRFELRIPLKAPCGRIGPHRIIPRAPGLAAGGARLRGLVILVAEDNPANRLVLEELLNGEGCWLVQVENGLEAVERVRQDRAGAFDLVLMDIQMPVMDGLEATGRIRELAPELPIVGLTAHALQSEREHCLAVGMVDHVAKPIELDTLVQTILRHVARGAHAVGAERRSAAALEPRRPSSLEDAPVAAAEAVDSWIDWPALQVRYAGNPAFLPRLLESILSSSADQSACLRRAFESDDLEQVAFIAHRWKGTAGTLFAEGLSLLAARAESDARERRTEASRSARHLADAVDQALREIRESAWMQGHLSGACSAAESAATGGLLSECVDQLRVFLEMDDTQANAVYDRDRELLIQAFGEEARRLGLQIEQFDYPAALRTLNDLMAQGRGA